MDDVKAAIANPEPTTFRNQTLKKIIDKNSITVVVRYADEIEKYAGIYKKVKKYIDDAGWSSSATIVYDGVYNTLYLNLLPKRTERKIYSRYIES